VLLLAPLRPTGWRAAPPWALPIEGHTTPKGNLQPVRENKNWRLRSRRPYAVSCLAANGVKFLRQKQQTAGKRV
jgi:hypothetical protein